MNDRRMRFFSGITAMVVGGSLAMHGAQAEAQTMQATSYSTIQADAGRALYPRLCAPCHGAALEGGEAGPALRGQTFMNKWREKPFAELFEQTRRTMPITQPAGLPREQYEQLLAYMMASNGIAASTSALVAPAPKALPDTEWLQHRGDAGSLNYSALDQIDRHSIARLTLEERQFRCLDLPQL
jgi:mono/diheme cytochrome c family protein